MEPLTEYALYVYRDVPHLGPVWMLHGFYGTPEGAEAARQKVPRCTDFRVVAVQTEASPGQ